MAKETGTMLDSIGGENLIAGTFPAAHVITVDLSGGGVIPRGTVMTRESDGSYAVLGEGSGEASAVLAQTTEEDDEIAEVYVTGNFYRDTLLMADGYELTADDENNLRKNGPILLSNGI